MYRNLTPILSGVVVMACAVSANAQTHQHTASGHNHVMHDLANASAQVANGPHGGSLRQTDGMQIETVVSQGGIQLFVFDRSGQPVSVDQGRGAASLRVEGNAKRYRYELLPDGKGGLTAPVNLSAIAGRQIEIDIQLVGIPTTRGRSVSFQEVASVPASEQQLAAAAIARQKICPVTGKPLGSMGDPVAVDVNGQRLYVCCAGCVNTVKDNPAKYAAGRPEITVTNATKADAALIARQKVCPVMDERLGGMGNPIKVMIGDKPIFLCCKGCIKKIQAEPAKYLAMVYGNSPQEQAPTQTASAVPAGGQQVRAGVFKVTAADAPFIAAQKRCPVMDEPLDAMGGPFKVHAAGKAIYICCPGCAKKIAAEPQMYLDILAKQGVNAPVLQSQTGAAVVPAGGQQVRAGVFKVTAADVPFVAAQKRCPVMDEPLDAMGGPFKVDAAGKAIYICCPGCAKKIAAEPQKYLGILAKQGVNAPILR
jgi:YHS domain-containing protein